MKIRYGQTRLVIITGAKAYKIARIRPIRAILRMPFLLFSKRLRERFSERYGEIFYKAIIYDVFAGIIANKIEYNYWQEKHDCRVIPTLSIKLFGLLIIQEKAEEISEEELNKNNPFGSKKIPDASSVTQFGKFCGKIILFDYGDKRTCKELIKV